MKWFRCKNLVLQPSRKIRRNGRKCFPIGFFLHDTRHFFVLFFYRRGGQNKLWTTLTLCSIHVFGFVDAGFLMQGLKGSGTVVICTVWFLCCAVRMISYGSGRVSYLGSGRHCALYCRSCLFVRCWNWKCVRGKNTLPSTWVGGASKFLEANWCAKQKLCNMRTPSMFARNEGLDILIFAGEVEHHRKPLFFKTTSTNACQHFHMQVLRLEFPSYIFPCYSCFYPDSLAAGLFLPQP